MNEKKLREERCEICGEPMPKGEEMFKYHGYSGPCPKDERNDYVAWCCYTKGAIRTCDSDTPGAFKVYRRAALAEEPASALTPHQKAVEEAAGYGIDWGLANGHLVGMSSKPASAGAGVEELRKIVEHAKTKTPCASNYQCLLADLVGLLAAQRDPL
jgi:hypothetical protein